MKRKSFLIAVIAMAVSGLDKAFGATKKPSPKPSVLKKPVAKISPTPLAQSPVIAERILTRDGNTILKSSLRAPISFYASYSKDGRDYPVLVANPTSKVIRVFSARCPHQGNILNLESHGEFYCEFHGARFKADSGKVIDGPTIQNLEQFEIIESSDFLVIRA